MMSKLDFGDLPEQGFLYPTEALHGQEWLPAMLSAWTESGRKRLCFPFSKFTPRTLPAGGRYWLYMYFAKNATDVEGLKGTIRYRFRVLTSQPQPTESSEVFTWDFGGGETVWFLCDRAEEIVKMNGALLRLDDFSHQDNRKELGPALRKSIAPVNLDFPLIKTVQTYPPVPKASSNGDAITHDPRVMGGKPCIRGLRVTVGTVLGLMAGGCSRQEILRLYPYLVETDLDAALTYAAWRMEEAEVSLGAP